MPRDKFAGDSLVSVIMPTYNRPSLTAEAIKSVQNQRYPNWELLVVDDGSTDDTQSVLATFSHDPRIQILFQPNRGQAAARNLGLKHARGDWIAFLDSDDLWLPQKLEAQMSFISSHTEIDVLYGDLELIDFDGNRMDERPTIGRYSGEVWRHLLRDNFVPFSTAVVRTQRLRAIDGFNESLRRADDYDMWLRLSVGSIFQFQPFIGTRYRMAGGRISDDLAGRFDSNLEIIERFLATHPHLLTQREAAAVRSQTHSRFARGFASRGQFRLSLKHALKCVSYRPSSIGSWRTLVATGIEPIRNQFRVRS